MKAKTGLALFGLGAAFLIPASAWALGGGAGCADLPDYDRAQGALEGMPGACDMTVEQARKIVAEHDGPAAVYQQAPAASHRRHRHRQRLPPQ